MSLNVRHYIDSIVVLTQKEIKVRYKSSFLGYLWSIVHPLALALVFFIAFKVVMKINTPDYTLFLIAGLFPWQWMFNSINASPMVFLGNASIIKKVNFPTNILPFTTVLQDMLHFVFSIPVIVIFIFIYHRTPYLSWCYGIPLLLSIQFLMVYGISLMISSINLFFRDMERLTSIFMTLLFYFTPVVYPETMIPERYQHLINLNPVAPLMISWRNLFLNGLLEPALLMISFAYAVIIFMAGQAIYKKLSWRFAEVL